MLELFPDLTDAAESAHAGRLRAGCAPAARRLRLSAGWERYQGPRHGHGWKSLRTGLVRYQEAMPGEHEHHADRGAGGKAPVATKPAKPEAAKPAKPKAPKVSAWDGTIDPANVSRRGRDREHLATWDFYDSDGAHFPQEVFLIRADYDPDPDNPDSEPVDVYQWESRQDGDTIESGGWTAAEDEAREGGEQYAEDNHQQKPPEEEDDEEEDDEDDAEDPEDEDESQPPPPLPKKTAKLGKSKAKVVPGSLTAVEQKELGPLAEQLFGKDGLAAAAALVGAPDDAEVVIADVGKYETLYTDDIPLKARGIRVKIKHSKLDSGSRFLGIDTQGRRFIRNEILEVKKAHQKEGLGAEIFARQVESAAEGGFAYIATHAAGGPGETMNGYYTWPRFGYNESLKSIARHNPEIAKAIRQEFPDARSIRDVMATEEGRVWWKANGGDLHDARFDLREGSWSRYILDTYLEECGQRKAQLSLGGEAHGGRGVEGIDLNPEEEAALERTWRRVGQALAERRTRLALDDEEDAPSDPEAAREVRVRAFLDARHKYTRAELEALRPLALRLSLLSDAEALQLGWERYGGRRGGKGWKHTETGRVVYQEKMPGERGKKQAQAAPAKGLAEAKPGPKPAAKPEAPPEPAPRPKPEVAPKPRAPKPAPQPKPTRPTVQQVTARVQGMLLGQSLITPQHVEQLAQTLLGMTVKDIQAVKKGLGLKASGLKAQLAQKVAQRALAAVGAKAPAAQPSGERPAEAAPPPGQAQPPGAPAAPPASPDREALLRHIAQMHAATPETHGYKPGVSLAELRKRSGLPPERFDAALQQLRRDRKVRLVAAGNAGALTPEEKAAAVHGEKEIFTQVEPREPVPTPEPPAPKPPAEATPPAQPPAPPAGKYLADLELEDHATAAGYRNFDAFAHAAFGLDAAARRRGVTPDRFHADRRTARLADDIQEFRERTNKPIAAKLRGGESLTPDEQRQVDAVNHEARAAALPVPAEAYRKVSFPTDLKPGDVVSDPAPLFVGFRKSIVGNIDAGRGQKLWAIRADAGAPMLYVNGPEPYLESIIPSGAKLRVESVSGDTVTLRYAAPTSGRKPPPAVKPVAAQAPAKPLAPAAPKPPPKKAVAKVLGGKGGKSP
jgi:hypothetical protein